MEGIRPEVCRITVTDLQASHAPGDTCCGDSFHAEPLAMVGTGGDVVRVLLINSNLRDDLFAAPPIGLCYVASATEAAGHTVKVLDLCFRRNLEQEVVSTIRAFSPDVVGISLRNVDNVNLLYPVSYLPDAGTIVQHVRRTTGAPIVVGGSGASLSPSGIMKYLNPDFLVVSDGERSFVDLLACLETGTSPKNIPGVAMIHAGKFSLNRPKLQEFVSGNPELGKWLDLKPYQKMGSSYSIQTKRGCTQRCIYCTYNQVLEGNKLRLRSPGDVVDEIEEALFKYRPETFEFVDSVFNAPKDHCTEILEEIVRRPWQARFTAMGVSPRKLDHRFLELMRRAGFISLMITPESASDTMIRNYRKGFTVDDVIHAAEAINRTRFMSMWFFLIGGPGETNQTLQESLDFTLKYINQDRGPFHRMANFFVGVRVYPGTRLWEIACDEGFVKDSCDDLDHPWYLSESLDLDQAIEQMLDAAAQCPQLISGFDEQYLALSNVMAFVGELLHLEKPYWNVLVHANRIVRKTVLKFSFRPKSVADTIRHRLALQRDCLL